MSSPETPYYFAYGSNMSSRRLVERIPNARACGSAWASGLRLVCNKPSRDGSGKANLTAAPDSIAWGVVYRLEAPDWHALDAFEPGYTRLTWEVSIAAALAPRFPGHVMARADEASPLCVRAQVYLWMSEGPEIPPYDWYRDHLLDGAREHDLPREHIQAIESLGRFKGS